MSRRDTGFPGQQSALLGNKKKFNVSSGLVKAPVSTMGGESSALKSYHSNKLGGGSKLEKIPLSNNIGEKPLYEPSKNQFLPDQSNSKLTTRRGTGFPGQDSRIPHYKTSLIKPEKEETGVVNQEVHSEVTEMLITFLHQMARQCPKGGILACRPYQNRNHSSVIQKNQKFMVRIATPKLDYHLPMHAKISCRRSQRMFSTIGDQSG